MACRVDDFLDRRRVPGVYDCLDFTVEVWRAETGEDLTGRLHSLVGAGKASRQIGEAARRFRKLAKPADPCLVVMHGLCGDLHIGVYLRGRVLHLLARPEFMAVDVASRGFSKVSFYQ